ncbi:Unknown protein, partial [Striga hermonthica]
PNRVHILVYSSKTLLVIFRHQQLALEEGLFQHVKDNFIIIKQESPERLTGRREDRRNNPTTRTDYSAFFKDPNFVKGISNLITQIRPSTSQAPKTPAKKDLTNTLKGKETNVREETTRLPGSTKEKSTTQTGNEQTDESCSVTDTRTRNTTRSVFRRLGKNVADDDLRKTLTRRRTTQAEEDEMKSLRRRIAKLEARRSAQKRLVSTGQDLTEVPLKRATTTSRARTESSPTEPESPLTFDILQEQLPEKIKIPQIRFYDGTYDPDTHLGLYTSWMDLHGAQDALRCRMFSLTLGEKAQRWYHSLAPHSVARWSQLKSMFRAHFIRSQACRIPKESITHIIQGVDKSLKNYITRFNEWVQNMEPCHQKTLLVSAYSGLRPNSMFKWTLCQKKPQTYHEFLMKAQQHIMAEEN